MENDTNNIVFRGADAQGSTLINLCGCLFHGSLVRRDAENWVIELRSALDPCSLTVANLDVRLSQANGDQFVALSRPGIARQLARSPVLSQENDTIRVDLVVQPALPRRSAETIVQDIIPGSVTEEGDVALTPGGKEEIARWLERFLSTPRGGHRHDPDWGSSHRDYVTRHGRTWLADFIALEIARSAFIPEVSLDFIRSVREVNLRDNLAEGSSTHADIVLDVEGVGEWSGKVEIVL